MATWIQTSRDGSPYPPGLTHRDTARVVVYKNRVVLSGGFQYGGTAMQDLWWSGDGAKWTLATATTPYPVYTPITVHNGRIYSVGTDEIRYTEDLTTYTTVATTPFSDNLIESSLIGDFDGKMWLFLKDKIRYSTDGFSWNITPSVPWTGDLGNYSAIKHDGYIYVFSGSYETADAMPENGYASKTLPNKVWRTSDPINGAWTEYDAPWGPRLWPTAQSHNGFIYVVSGYNNLSAANYDDTWKCSTDMVCEKLETDALYLANTGAAGKYIDPELTNLSYTARHWPSLYSFNGHLRMCAGNRNPDPSGTVNDCWLLQE